MSRKAVSRKLMPDFYRKWVLAKPLIDNRLSLDLFEIRSELLPDLAEGEALVRVRLINIHSATRARIANGTTKIGDTDRTNYACAEVVQSRDPAFKVGDIIACQAGWQEYQVVRSADPCFGYGPISASAKALNGTNSQWTYVFRRDMTERWPTDVLMDVFGTSGMTAYFGLRECGPLRAGDTVVVAGASGSVGAIAAQLARIAGCRVIGIAGGNERCRSVTRDLGIAGCVNYKSPGFTRDLASLCPDGIDVFSDGVGDYLTEAVTPLLKRGGRLFAYGSAAAFYSDSIGTQTRLGTPLRRMFGISENVETLLAERGARAECWIVDAFYHERLEAEDAMSALLDTGQLKAVSAVVEGFDNLPQAVVDLYQNARAGKLQVRFDN